MGHFLVIQALSAYGADFNLTASTGENALHFATKNYRLLCIRMLAQRGMYCNIHIGNSMGLIWKKKDCTTIGQ